MQPIRAREGMTSKELRRKLKKHYQESERVFALWRERGYQYPPPKTVPFPDECRGMTCGARTRAGTPCKRVDLYRNGRCKLHGGLSTGPKTLEGRRRSALNIGKNYDDLLAAKQARQEPVART
jgi:hypothetical protein